MKYQALKKWRLFEHRVFEFFFDTFDDSPRFFFSQPILFVLFFLQLQ